MMGCGGGAVGGQPRWWTRQHHSFLSAAQVFSGSTAQLKGSTGPLGAGGLVGGGRVAGGGGGGGGGGGWWGVAEWLAEWAAESAVEWEEALEMAWVELWER